MLRALLTNSMLSIWKPPIRAFLKASSIVEEVVIQATLTRIYIHLCTRLAWRHTPLAMTNHLIINLHLNFPCNVSISFRTYGNTPTFKQCHCGMTQFTFIVDITYLAEGRTWFATICTHITWGWTLYHTLGSIKEVALFTWSADCTISLTAHTVWRTRLADGWVNCSSNLGILAFSAPRYTWCSIEMESNCAAGACIEVCALSALYFTRSTLSYSSNISTNRAFSLALTIHQVFLMGTFNTTLIAHTTHTMLRTIQACTYRMIKVSGSRTFILTISINR